MTVLRFDYFAQRLIDAEADRAVAIGELDKEMHSAVLLVLRRRRYRHKRKAKLRAIQTATTARLSGEVAA